MFALAGDLLHDVWVDVQGAHLLIPDRCVQSRSARCRRVAVAREQRAALHGGPDAASPLASKAAIDVTAGHLPVGIAHRRAPSPGRHRGPAGRREEPHARGVRAEPSAAGSGCASLLSSPRPVVAGPSRRKPARLGTGSSGTVRARAPDRRHPKVPTSVEILRGRPRYPKAPVRLAAGQAEI